MDKGRLSKEGQTERESPLPKAGIQPHGRRPACSPRVVKFTALPALGLDQGCWVSSIDPSGTGELWLVRGRAEGVWRHCRCKAWSVWCPHTSRAQARLVRGHRVRGMPGPCQEARARWFRGPGWGCRLLSDCPLRGSAAQSATRCPSPLSPPRLMAAGEANAAADGGRASFPGNVPPAPSTDTAWHHPLKRTEKKSNPSPPSKY